MDYGMINNRTEKVTDENKEGVMCMKKGIPWEDIFLIAAIIYFLSPVDLVPGVIADDLAALGAALLPILKRAMWL